MFSSINREINQINSPLTKITSWIFISFNITETLPGNKFFFLNLSIIFWVAVIFICLRQNQNFVLAAIFPLATLSGGVECSGGINDG